MATHTATATTNKYKSKTPTCIDKTPTSELDLSIISFLAVGLNPAKIAIKLDMSKSALQYHLTKLKRQGRIRKLGYGTWEITNPPEQLKKRSTNSSHVGIPQDPPQSRLPRLLSQSSLSSYAQDAVRAHAITTTWRIPPALRNWDNRHRTRYLDRHSIPYKPLGIGGGGQRIIIKDRKVWLTNRSIIIYDKSSYFADAALQAKNTAIATHLSILRPASSQFCRFILLPRCKPDSIHIAKLLYKLFKRVLVHHYSSHTRMRFYRMI